MRERQAKMSKRYKVGYGLSPKKVESFIRPSLLTHANDRGIDLVQVDTNKPLIEQGPFHCLLHKLYGPDWNFQLQDFISKYPSAFIIDSPSSIQRLHNRISMLEVVEHLQVPSLGIPKQIVVDDSKSLLISELLETLNFPVIAKPLLVDGTANSHEMSLVFNFDGLKKVKPPVVLQEFVNHGGVVFKVYVAGDYVNCVKRRSLPDVSQDQLGSSEGGILSFSQISNLSVYQQQLQINEAEDGDKCSDFATNIEAAEMPSMDFVQNVAEGLSQVLKLHLFNFDMIRDARVGNSRYLIIDINYFPGYAKVPGFETMFTDFLWDVVNREDQGANLD